MAKNLLIVESPTKTRTLANFLGKDFDIVATVGHIRDLPKSRLGVDPENGFKVDYETIKGKEKIVAELRKAAKKADKIYLAPDPDREGEAIAWHIAEAFKKTVKAPLYRVTFNEITKGAVKEAIANPREINMDLVNAQQARRVLDRIVGYTISPFLWKTVAYNLSAGRVQSVALRLVCEREDAVIAFVSEEYWNVNAQLLTRGKKAFSARLFKVDEKSVVSPTDKGTNKLVISSEKEVNKILADLEGADYSVDAVKDTERTRKPYAPFITSTLQQEGAKAHGFSPKRTMALAQQLYEGVEMKGGETTGLITYMRTDSYRVAGEAISAVRDYIGSEYGAKYLPKSPAMYGKKKKAQDAHEAIRPTYLSLSPEKLNKKLSPQQLKLYTLIWNRFIASQMMPARFNMQTVDITAGKYTFRATAQSIKFDGFLKVYHEAAEADENANGDKLNNLPPLKVGDKVTVKKIEPVQSFTKPPARFSEAMLVKQMEADGIGRPSTYAATISTLRGRKYVDLIEKRLHPTDLGMTVNRILVSSFPDLINVKFTATMEEELDQIEAGTDDWIKVMSEFYTPFMAKFNEVIGRVKEIKESMTEKTDIKCEKCGEAMIIKWGRNGRFLACSGYPKCKNAQPLPEEAEQMKTDEVCEKCNSAMVIKTGRYGRFLACSSYPDCKNTKPVTLGIDCPKDGCKDGKLVEKQTKTKRLFYGCSNYPKCDYASWDKPVKQPCPFCKHAFVVQKTSKVKGEYLKCPECKSDVPEAPSEAASTKTAV